MPTDAKTIRPPAKYRAPLRSAAAMRAYLLGRQPHDGYRFAFNVKAGCARIEFDHLLALWREQGGGYSVDPSDVDAEWIEAARTRFNPEAVYEWGLVDARDTPTNDDAYSSLWDGTPVDVEYGYAGRSGGWLVFESLDGYAMAGRSPNELSAWVESLDFATLRKLYRFVVQCEADFTPSAAAREVEYRAAFRFFDVYVADADGMPAPNAGEDLGAGI